LIRVTLDTNILVSAFLQSGNERKVLEAVIEGKLKSVTSPAILHELGKVLIRLGVGERQVEGYLLRVMEISEVCLRNRLDDFDIRDRKTQHSFGQAKLPSKAVSLSPLSSAKCFRLLR